MNMKRMMMAVAIAAACVLWTFADVAVTDVVARQRYPWNGLVDITCKVTGIEGTTNGLNFAVAAVMPDTGKARNVSYFWVLQGGTNFTDRAIHVNGDYQFLWDAKADLGIVRYTNMVVRITVVDHEKIQLWEHGPYWATTNIGAEEPWQYGYYFWWGDTVGCKRARDVWVATDGSSSNFSFDSSNTSTIYKSVATLQREGWIVTENDADVLALEHDAAHVQWGDGWRMPTYQELRDLNNKCDWCWTTMNGVRGYLVRGIGDYASANIFLPAVGYAFDDSLQGVESRGTYWSSVLSDDQVYSYGLTFDPGCHGLDSTFRDSGFPVRPVIGYSSSVGQSGMSKPFQLDTMEGARVAGEIETITYSPRWNDSAECSVEVMTGSASLDGNNESVSLVASAIEEGVVTWTRPEMPGLYTLTHTAGEETQRVQFAVLGTDVVCINGGNINTTTTWSADKIRLICGMVTVANNITLTIEPGTVVKFMPGAKLIIESGSRCVAKSVKFTHVCDDTVGGDTLFDGPMTLSSMEDYEIRGTIMDDDSTEYRHFESPFIVTDVIAKQRYPWNGLVDITCKVSGIDSTTKKLKFAVTAMNSDLDYTHKVSHFWVVQNGTNSLDHEVHADGDYRLLWNAQADIGQMAFSNMIVRITLVDARKKIQLWKDGPYWAETNIGAEYPWEYGYYFWWGDHVGYKWENDAWVPSNGLSSDFLFDNYCYPSGLQTYGKSIAALQTEGWITADNSLALEHDAAQVQWGGGWRMPTIHEMTNLCEKCDWTWVTTNGVNGYIVRGRNAYASASIFLPAGGYGDGDGRTLFGSIGQYLQSSTAYSSDDRSIAALGGRWVRSNIGRATGSSIRPVFEFGNGTSTAAFVMTTGLAGDSAPFLLDTVDGTRIAMESEMIAYSPYWNGAVSCSVTADGNRLVSNATAEGLTVWDAANAGSGAHTLMHTAGDETLTARFAVLGDGVEVHAGTLGTLETWETNKTHLITAAITVPGGATLTIESGAVVKFMFGTSLTVANGGKCTANGVVFTHVNDDTIGGDTLFDGDSTSPVMGGYSIAGNITDDDSTEYRYLPPQTLTSNISSNTRLRGYRTYIVSNSVTVASGVTLTLQPGTILKFNDGCSLTVNGILNAQGTRAAPIVFTSLKDDEHGGDTNGDRDNTMPNPGDWVKVCINGGTANFNYAKILYSSKNATTGAINMTSSGGRVVFANGEIAHAAYDAIGVESGNCHVTNSVIHDCLLAFRHWTRDPIVNCVIYDCGRLTQGGGQHFYNCIFSHIIETWEAFGFPQNGTTYRNCCFWNENGSVLTAEGRQDAMTVCGKNGNIWANPRFLDPENGDFRIAGNSPCINAGDATYAPEFDYFGQPRDGAPDIGIYEVVSETGYDLAAVAVSSTGGSPVQGDENAQAARSTIGDTITISYTVANVGREAVADPWHDALYLVSSSSGKQYALGEPLNPGALGAGESRTFTAQFAVPVVPVGQYRLRLAVNSRRMDVPEGVTTENNVVVSEGEIEVAANSVDAAEGVSGSIAAGASAVCAFNIPEGSGEMLLRITSAVGGTSLSARSGLGFLPVDASSGNALSFSGGVAWLSVPARTEKVWLVLDNAGTSAATYTVDFHDGALALAGVSPSSIPSSGNVTVEIEGAGFTDDCEVSFTGAGTVAPLAVRRVSSGLLTATVDAAAFGAGSTYAVTVRKGDESKTIENALTVEKAPGKPKFWAKLDVPGSMRQGRLVQTCYIEYGNSGTADMASPVLQVSLTGDGTLGYIDGLSGLKTLQFIAAGEKGSAGVLRPGSSHRIRFAVRAGASNKISLHTSEGSSYAPAPWTNAADYCRDISKAADRVASIGLNATDYAIVREFAERIVTNSCFGTVSGVIRYADGNVANDFELSLSGTNNAYIVKSNDEGEFVFPAVDPDRYVIAARGVQILGVENIILTSGDDLRDLELVVDSTLNCHLVMSGFNNTANIELINLSTEENFKFTRNGNDDYIASGLPVGRYVITITDVDGSVWQNGFVVDGSRTAVSLFAEKLDNGKVIGTVQGQEDYDVRVVALYSSNDMQYKVLGTGENEYLFENLAPGYYSLTLYCISGELVDLTELGSFELKSGAATNIVSSGVVMTNRHKNLLSFKGGKRDLIDALFDPDAIKREYEKRLQEFTSVWYANTVTLPIGDYACEHNMEKYEKDCALWSSYKDFVLAYTKGANRTSMDKFLAKWFWLFHKGNQALFDTFLNLYTKGQMKVWQMAIRDTLVTLGTYQFAEFEGELIDEVGEPIAEKDYNAAYAALSAAAKASDQVDSAILAIRTGQYAIQKMAGMRPRSSIGYTSQFMKSGAGAVLSKMNDILTLGKDLVDAGDAALSAWNSMQELDDAYDYMVYMTYLLDVNLKTFKKQAANFNQYPLCCKMCYPEQPYDPPIDNKTPSVPKSCDPNEMVGDEGVGDARYVKPGQELTYTICFENKAGFDIADAQEVRVMNPLNEWLDWSTFEMRESAFGDQSDVALDGLTNGTSEIQMEGTNKYVRTTVEYDVETGVATWYMRVYDPNGDSEGYPTDGSGFLPSNDDTHRGEGHITYRIKVREDAPSNVVITNSAIIVFDHNNPIETDPAWWNTVGQVQTVEIDDGNGGAATQLVVGAPYGDALPESPVIGKPGHSFGGWFTGLNGTGRRITAASLVEQGDSGVYPNWIANTYEVRFNANGGTGEMSNQAMTYGVAAQLVLNVFTNEGNRFGGWAISPDGAAVYDDCAEVVNLTSENGALVDLYATWEAAPVPPVDNVDRKLYAEIKDAASGVASEYNGFIADDVGNVKGVIVVKVGKPGKKDGQAAVKATITGLDGKKKTLAAVGGKIAISADSPTVVTMHGGDPCELTLGEHGMSGSFGTYKIDGAKNVFSSKDAEDKAVADGMMKMWQGVCTVAWIEGTAVRPEAAPYQVASVTIAKKGKVKVTGVFSDGTKISGTGQLIVGKDWCCVPVVVTKKRQLAFVLWLPRGDSAVIAINGLGDDVKVGRPGTLQGQAAFHIDADAFAAMWRQITLPYLPDGVSVSQRGSSWAIPKAGKLSAKNGVVDDSKAGENPAGLKIKYKAKDGSFKGSFSAYSLNGGKLIKAKVDVNGVQLDGKGYGSAAIKKLGAVPVRIEN